MTQNQLLFKVLNNRTTYNYRSQGNCKEERFHRTLMNLLPIKATESYQDVRVNESLNIDQREVVILSVTNNTKFRTK